MSKKELHAFSKPSRETRVNQRDWISLAVPVSVSTCAWRWWKVVKVGSILYIVGIFRTVYINFRAFHGWVGYYKNKK